jgi:secondary thiamine-phosphate synthase enzyme
MKWYKTTLIVSTHGKGFYSFDEQINAQLQARTIREGMCYLFCQHTSASLVISENYDPTAKADLVTFMERIVPENASWYTHDLEGSDDSTSHIRSMLTDVSLTIPVDNSRLCLGTWQGVFLFEHRTRPQSRHVLMWVLTTD